MTGRLTLTDRDRALIHAAWSLGYAPAVTLRALVSPQTAADTLRDRLHRLTQSGHLSRQRIVGPVGQAWLYAIGPAAMADRKDPWRPSIAQLSHTLIVAHAVVALTRPGFAYPLTVTGWKGEAEVRDWAVEGAPFPDAEISWRHQQRQGRWQVEVDRATESRTAWRRKLVRYLTTDGHEPVLTLTTSQARANNLAAVAADLGVHVLATTLEAVRSSADPSVLDSRARKRHPLSAATLGEDRG